MNLLTFSLLLLRASFLSTSGMGNVPALHHDLIHLGWAKDAQFIEALSIGQIAPGPSGLWVISLSFMINGWMGAGIALVAIILPPMLVLIVGKVYYRLEDHRFVRGFTRGLAISVTVSLFIVLFRILQSAGIDVKAMVIFLGTVGTMIWGRIPIPAILLFAGIVGIIWP